MLSVDSLLGDREGLTRFDRKIKIISWVGSTHKLVPVKPVWPYVSMGVPGLVGLVLVFRGSGLSNPSPRRLTLLFVEVKRRTVSSLKSLSPPYVPPLSHIWQSLARSFALEKSPALPEMPPKRAAPSSWTCPRSCFRKNVLGRLCSRHLLQGAEGSGRGTTR